MSLLIENIAHGWVGYAEGTRLPCTIRIENGRIDEMGALTLRRGEESPDATGCVVVPGLVSTHNHLFQSALKGLAMNAPLDTWLEQVPDTYWPRLDDEALRISDHIGFDELALSGATIVCDQHYIFSDRFD